MVDIAAAHLLFGGKINITKPTLVCAWLYKIVQYHRSYREVLSIVESDRSWGYHGELNQKSS